MQFAVRAAAALMFAGLAMAIAGGAMQARAEAPPPTAEERARVETIVRDYLMRNPELILESLRSYEAQQRAQTEREGNEALAALQGDLESGQDAPVAGNADGDVTIVEFFDYQCGYCKRVLPDLQKVMETDAEVRVVLREFPILGPASVMASRAALAVWKLAPDQYLDFHVALMNMRGQLTEERVMAAIEERGLDPEAVREAMTSEAVENAIRQNLQLGRAINVRGTPAFVIGGELVPGAIDLATFREKLAAARSG
jgi:protein-disulfide isomerase